MLSPGWVQTDMDGSEAPATAAESVTSLFGLIDRLTLKDSGSFFGVRGERIAW